MSYSIIEQNFEKNCHTIHPDINPDVFIQRYNRYSKEYLPMIEDIMTNMHETLHNKFPNIQFSLKGRIKSKRSFLIKSLVSLAKNILNIFPEGDFDHVKRDEAIYTYFKFLQKSDSARYEYFKKLIDKLTPLGALQAFPILFEKLSKDEQNMLVYRLGRTEDTFAYRLIIHSVDFENLIAYSKEHSDGTLTFLQDSFVYNDSSGHENSLNIQSIEYDEKHESYFVLTPDDERINISQLLNTTDLKLQKHDEVALTDSIIYDIYDTVLEYYTDNNILSIPSRYKNYIKKPKPTTDYKSIHDSAVDLLFGLTLEGQLRTLKMEDDAKDEGSRIGHDVYKKQRSKSQLKNPFLAKILLQNKIAFDSSSITLMEILENPSIDISELLGTYFLTTSLPDGSSYTYKPDIDKVFEHTFGHSFRANIYKSPNNLDFSSYRNFIISKKRFKENLQDEPVAHLYDDY